MISRLRHALTVCSIATLALIAHAGSAATSYTETWSSPPGLAGWISTVPQLALQNTGGTLEFIAANGFDDAGPVAGPTASGGAFVGDLGAIGAQFYAFDILIDEGSDLDNLGIGVLDLETQERWLTTVAQLPDPGVWTHYEFPLSPAAWSRSFGTHDFAWMLANVDFVSVGFSEPDTGNGVGVTGQLDNFTLQTPEPGTFALFGAGALGLCLWRRGRKSGKVERR